MTESRTDGDLLKILKGKALPACLIAPARDPKGELVDLVFKAANQALAGLFPKAGIASRVKRISYFELPYFQELLRLCAQVLASGEPACLDIKVTNSSQPYRCAFYRYRKREIVVTLAATGKRPGARRTRVEEESGLEGFFDSGPIKFIIDSRTGRILEANKAALAFYGWTKAQFLAMNIAQLDSGEASDIAACMEAVERGGYAILQRRHRLASGEARIMEVHASMGVWDGRPIHFSIVLPLGEKAGAIMGPEHIPAPPAACLDVQECFGPFLERYAKTMPYLSQLMADLLPFGQRMRYYRGDHFLEFGGHSPNVGFIVSGLFRQYSLTASGTDCTLGFYRPGQILDTFAYAEFERDCPLAFEARCESDVFIISRKVLRPLVNRDPRWWKLFYYNLSSRLISRNEREISLLSDDAATRYALFLEKEGDSLPHLQSYHVASYLGVTSETLSRIKKKQGGKRPTREDRHNLEDY